MANQHSTRLVVDEAHLREMAGERLRESQALLEAGHHAGSMFMGGCALECLLKAAICRTLRLSGLPSVFKTHDLEALLLYSGFQNDLLAIDQVKQNLEFIVQCWEPDGREKLLYQEPSQVEESTAIRFHQALIEEKIGVFTWVQKVMS